MFPGMKAQEITALFTETDTLGYTKLKVVSIKTVAQSQDEALARLDRAFTSWMFDKDEGKDVWERSEGLFNIDAALRCFNHDGTPLPSLRPYLEAEGIYLVRELCNVERAEHVKYDRILAQQPEL